MNYQFSFGTARKCSAFIVSLKLCLNLCPRKWLKPIRNLVSSLISIWSWILEILLSDSLMKFIKRGIANFGVEFVPIIYKTWKEGILKLHSALGKSND